MNELYPFSCATPICHTVNTNPAESIAAAEEQLINSLLAAAIGREPLKEDFFKVELAYSSTNPNVRFLSVDGKCLGALVYTQETLIGDSGTQLRVSVQFDSELRR